MLPSWYLIRIWRSRVHVHCQSGALWRRQDMTGWWNGRSRFSVQWIACWRWETPVAVGRSGWGGARRVHKVIGRLFGGGALCGWEGWAWLAGACVRWKRSLGAVRGRGEGREWAGWKVISGFGAGHFVDLYVVGGENAATGGAWDPTLQPVIIHPSCYGYHLALKEIEFLLFLHKL